MDQTRASADAVTDWESYLCNVNDSIASVFVDLSLAKQAPAGDLPKLAWLWIRLVHPGADGLSTDEEFDALCAYEDRLEGFFDRQDGCLYAGRITTIGRREFYFYTATDFDFPLAAEQFLMGDRSYEFHMGSKDDALWLHYSNTLFPGEDGMKQIVGRRATL